MAKMFLLRDLFPSPSCWCLRGVSGPCGCIPPPRTRAEKGSCSGVGRGHTQSPQLCNRPRAGLLPALVSFLHPFWVCSWGWRVLQEGQHLGVPAHPLPGGLLDQCR